MVQENASTSSSPGERGRPRMAVLVGFLRRHLRWVVVAGVVLAVIAGLVWWNTRSGPPRYVTSPVTRGDVVRSIITSGAVNPVVTVQVGTYVSGVIKAIYCDFNTEVKAGQLCAKIDPRPYQLIVDQDAANLASAQAQLKKDEAALAYAQTNYQRDLKLRKEGIVSQEELDSDRSVFNQARAQLALDKAAVKQREAALNAARVNLGYTDIVSPVDGIVVSRNVDVGQTVSASFQTPTLFLIAKGLTMMQVDTSVSESDVGAAKVGQKALFTVEAYPGKTFEGRVTQVRQAPITVQNVVTYDVVVSVDNPDRELLPGMTANTRIITEERKNVLRVPLQALRFTPGGLSARKNSGSTADRQSQPESRVWVLRDGKPHAVPVATGLTDNSNVEITGGELQAGDAVIVNETTSATSRSAPQRTRLRF